MLYIIPDLGLVVVITTDTEGTNLRSDFQATRIFNDAMEKIIPLAAQLE
jgi:hypothetical protein